MRDYGRAATAFDKVWRPERERILKAATRQTPNVVYWMSRDQRVHDNWALLRAQNLGGAVTVAYYMDETRFPTKRHSDFLVRGLESVETELGRFGIPLVVTSSLPGLVAAVEAAKASCVVCDFSPLREDRRDRDEVARLLPDVVELREVDAHNVVPVWAASEKKETAARTIRKKIESKLPRFLTEFPPVAPQEGPASDNDWDALRAAYEHKPVPPISWCEPGEVAAHDALDAFCSDGRLTVFAAKRNDPNARAISDLSPYYHFGHISPQRAALQVKARGSGEGVKAFLEESIVRRELTDNYVLYEPNYDSLDAAAGWARETLQVHAADVREYSYDRDAFEQARTHEDLWNAAQRQLVVDGKIHGFMRMYWCKKILEWSPSPEEALATALYLNDKYSIDGSDPNGFVGVAWSIMGIHDQGWAERPIFGKIRYMNYNGCKRKFDVNAYVAKYPAKDGPMDRALKRAAASPSAKKKPATATPPKLAFTNVSARKIKVEDDDPTAKKPRVA